MSLKSMVNSNFSQFYALINSYPGTVLIKDNASIFQMANKMQLQLLGFNDLDQFHGKSDDDIAVPVRELSEFFKKIDSEIMDSDRPIKLIEYLKFEDESKLFLVTQSSIRNEQDEVIGTSIYGLDLTDSILANVMNTLIRSDSKLFYSKESDQFVYLIDDNIEKYHFTERESECLFYITRGKGAKEIARILCLSPRTIESYIEKLKIKLNCFSKTQLIEKAVCQRLVRSIPKSFFQDADI